MNPSLRQPITDEQIRSLQQRNDERARAAIAALGDRYTLHPKHYVQRRTPRPMGGALC